MLKKKWFFASSGSKQDYSLLRDAGYPRLVGMVLCNRGINTPILAKKFFSPTLQDLEDPWLLPDVEKGLERVSRAIKKREKILVFGDYDVDGTTGTTILYKALKEIGGDVCYYLPHRLEEGYGLNLSALDNFALSGVKLIITVDCGTTNIKEVEYARKLGIDVIITDHHEPDDENIPCSYALINPKMKNSSYPFPYLAGVGVVLKFIQTLTAYYPQNRWQDYLGLAALGTIADIVPMIRENRVISFLGLTLLNRLPGMGLKALMDISSIDRLDTNAVLFKIAPRINALGRLDHASLAVKLLSVFDLDKARELAFIAEDRNRVRKSIQGRIMDEVMSLMEKREFKTSKSPIILSSSGWHVGVLGIVASKLVEKYYRPVYLIMSNGDDAKGSARGIEGFSIFESLSFCQDMLTKFGGHALAGGFSLRVSNLESFINKLEHYVEEHVEEDILYPTLNVEGVASFSEIDMALAEYFKSMEPFGTENPVPLFCSRCVQILDTRFMGKDEDHFKIIVRQGDVTHEAVGFMMGKTYASLIKPGSLIDIVYSIDINYWRDEPILRLTVKDIHPAIPAHISISSADRKNMFFRESVLSENEKSIIKRFLEKEKIIGSFHSFKTLMKILHNLVFISLHQRQKRLLVVHPLRVEADRHYQFLRTYFSTKGIKVFLLNGSINAIERENLLESLKLDFPCLIITTFDYLWFYKQFFHNIDLIVIDDNLLDYSSNVLIQLEDFASERGFLFCTLNSMLKTKYCMTISTGEISRPDIISYNSFPGDWFETLTGKTLICCLNDEACLNTKILLESKFPGLSVEVLLSNIIFEEQKNIFKLFKSGTFDYLVCSSNFLHEFSFILDNIILLYYPSTWNEFSLRLSTCKKLHLVFSDEDIEVAFNIICSRMPDRSLLIKCYKLLHSRYGGSPINFLYSDGLSRKIGTDLLRTCLMIFEEIGLYKISYNRTGYTVTTLEHKEKLDLLSSPCYLECIKQREHFDKLSGLLLKSEKIIEKYMKS
ncbi:MAG TPA: single-stranded-DNA-specific exonuclease RecJ [Candidatus Eremiobacteraeota bacterium]|nr:MAG: Single-stranded-DNA-specific exonuclease RecJ [bacterium ADurb.Bin363]HPZ08422.1 single-stranded-DNA-specific exonuclease RecJ [Candidatus Eremiobacteraeota bacterium]